MARQRKADSEELRRTNEALVDEMTRFNAALVRGVHVLFHAKAGDGRTASSPPLDENTGHVRSPAEP